MNLGQPIPPNDIHAVSVSLPHWDDVKGYEEGNPRVINAMQLGYPRFVYHPFIKQLCKEAEKEFAYVGEFCMVFPSKKVAEKCVSYCGSGKVQQFKNIYAVILKNGLERKAKEFWMHAGYIVSSRLAEDVLAGKEVKGHESRLKVTKKLAQLSGASEENIYLYPSGMAAIFAGFEAAGQGKTLQLGFPYVDTLKIQERFGKGKFIDYRSESDLAKLEAELKTGGVNAVITEFPLNPLLTCVDLEQVQKLCHAHNAALVVDDTLATWANIDVLKYADIAVTSLTKFFSGVGNVCAGSLILNANSPFYKKLKAAVDTNFEDLLYEPDAEILATNCADFEERIAKINANAEKFVEKLKAELPNGSEVFYTKGNAVYEKYKKPNGGYGGLVSVVLPTEQQAREYFDALECKKGPSLGTNYTLACPYTMLAHYYERDFAENAGVAFHLIRFSVGVE